MTLKQTLKEKWEANSIIFVVSLMGAAFVTGFGVRPYLSDPTCLTSCPRVLTCRYEGLEFLEKLHIERLEPLLQQLRELEKEASHWGNPDSFQAKYAASADRIRGDIKTENANHQAAIQTLNRDCN